MDRIRVLPARLPGMILDMLARVAVDQSDLEIIEEIGDGVELLVAVGQTHADVVVLGLRDSELPGICSHLLSEYPDLKILGVTADGRRGFLYELRPQRIPLGEISPEKLCAAIRHNAPG